MQCKIMAPKSIFKIRFMKSYYANRLSTILSSEFLLSSVNVLPVFTGFNAAVSGCFFAVESVLWPSPTDPSSLALTYTTSMVILSAVIGSVVSEVGLGSEPAFKVPEYDFRSPTGKPSICVKD